MSLNKSKIIEAAEALKKFSELKQQDEKSLFDSNNEMISVELTLSKIPLRAVHKSQFIEIPNPILKNQEVCIFVKDDKEDLNKKVFEVKRKFWKNKVKNLKITEVKKVISMNKLKKEYKQYSQLRQLCDSHDLFLCDSKIIENMPQLLGKYFYKQNKSKCPLPVVLKPENTEEAINKILNSTHFKVPTGPSVSIKVGQVSMESKDLAENVVESIKGAVKYFDKSNNTVLSCSIKFTNSPSLCIYKRGLDGEVKKTEKKPKVEESESEEEEKVEKKEKLPLLKKRAPKEAPVEKQPLKKKVKKQA